MVFSQKESANWYFGEFAGLNFNSGNPVPLLDGKLDTREGCATISDPNGNLLFYTDGVTVWDRVHKVMPNGQMLLGHGSSTESALIIPKPGSKSRFYIFTIDQPSYYLKDIAVINGVNYSEVDLTLNGGYGDIVDGVKNKHLVTYNPNDATENKYKSSEKITAVTHSDGSSIWVITNFMDRFYSFLVDVNGVNSNPVVSTVQQSVLPVLNDDGANVSAIGYLKVSPNGKNIAIAHSSTVAGSPRTGQKKSGKVLLYNFNNSNGAVSNQIEILSGGYPYGVEFSPNSKRLYITNSIFDENDTFVTGELYQYNLEASNVSGSKQVISSSQNIAGALQLAIDGKIYRAGYKVASVGLNISVIKSPNTIGVGCDYLENSISLGGKASKLGLPPFVQSIFLYSFDYELTCLGDQTHFYITSEEPYDSVVWDFGDGQTSIEESPNHVYNAAGVYSVSLTMSLNGIQRDPLIKQLIISEPPNILSDTYDLIQCDSYDANPNDGISVFNLTHANEAISLNTTEPIEIYYYQSLVDATNDTLNVKGLGDIYTNVVNDELLYAKVYKANTECYSIATVRLKTTQSLDLGLLELSECDFDNDDIADFNLEVQADKISTQLNLPFDISITFYEKEYDALIGVNALSGIYSSKSKSLFVRVESDNICYGNGLLQLNVKPFPVISSQTFTVCSTDFPVTIDSGISDEQVGAYDYYWNTQETTNKIVVNQPGIYEVTVTEPFANCDKTIVINIERYESPIIKKLEIEGRSMSVLLNNSDLEKYVYKVDDEIDFQQSNLFLNLEPGSHTVYVSDINSCEMVNYDFYIFGFPKYFTPNDDGSNDTWNAYGLNRADFDTDNFVVKIYNRYGKLLKIFNPFYSDGWDGKFKNVPMIADDYWYSLKLPNGEEFTGHFALKF
ncbi:T9SS type B sorting domain-containing protein [Mariniflexile aquimaris]|uniref:T9SS type B sorting domain-containing protein n=1 Tax=Mariniflexile aquimaris TaxID=881009 RepID=A0ABW3BN44_9FLAO